MKLTEHGRRALERQIFVEQYPKYAEMKRDLLHALRDRTFENSGFFADGVLICASAAGHRRFF